ncbi:hypothetical protein JCM10207_005324 [Rhodosporidiobolus poonsookiae]
MSPRVILITGTSSGVGRSLVEAALARGEIVVATLRKPEALDDLKSKYGSEQLLVLPFDITKSDQIQDVFDKAVAAFGKIDIVVNNAGVTLIGEVETSTAEQARALFDTNFFAPLEIAKFAVGFFRKQGGGILLQNTSSSATNAVAGLGIYSASKAALEWASDALRDELDPAWGIKVINLQIGGTKTNLGMNGTFIAKDPLYSNPSLPQNQMMAAFSSGSMPMADADKVAQAVLKTLALPADELPKRLILGADAVAAVQAKAAELAALAEHDKELAVSVM